MIRVAACGGIAVILGTGCGGDEGPPQEAQGAIRSVATAIGPCVDDPETAMAGVSVAQSDDGTGAFVVTLADGARFTVADGSPPEAMNPQADSLLASCP